MRAEGNANTLLATTGIQFSKYGFSTGIIGGLGLSTVTSTWNYKISQYAVDLNKQSFKEDYETKPTWLLGIKIAYTYPVTDRLSVGVSASVSLLNSAERAITKTTGTYEPEDYYDPELLRKSATNYSENYIFTGLLVEIKL